MRGKKPRWHKEPALKRLFHHHTSLYPANRQQHFEFLGQVLRRTLLRRDYGGAYKIYNSLVTSTPVSEEFVWKVREVARSTLCPGLYDPLSMTNQVLRPMHG